MSLRPYVAASALFGALLFNAFLFGFEDVAAYAQRGPSAALPDDTIPLATLRWNQGERLANLKTFGLQAAETEAITRRIRNSDVDPATLRQYLEDNREKTSRIFCVTPSRESMSPAYGAAAILVRETVPGSPRSVIPLDEVVGEYAAQPWFAAAPVPELYRALETRGARDSAATVYGVGALLTAKERTAVSAGTDMFVTYDRFLDDNAGVRRQLVSYFAELVPLAEAAHGRGGICGSRSTDAP